MTPRRDPTLHRLLIFASILIPLLILVWLLPRTMVPGPHEQATPRDEIRIVALSPAVAVTLRDLGLADRIVGRHGYDLALDPSIPVCGDQSGIDYEALIGVHPTHVLTERGAHELPARLASLAARYGWTVEDFTQLRLSDVIQSTTRLGSLFAPDAEPLPPEAAQVRQRLSQLVERMNAAWNTPHPPLHAGRILLLESVDPPAAVGPGSFHQDILERLGGTPAITTGKAYMTLDLEDILRLAPDGIVLLAPRAPRTPAAPTPSPQALRERLGRIATLDLPAMRTNHIALIDDPCCLLPSSSLLIYSDQLEIILKSWSAP